MERHRKRTHKLLLYTFAWLTSVLCPAAYLCWMEGTNPLPALHPPSPDTVRTMLFSVLWLAVSCISLVFAYQNLSIKQYRTKYHQIHIAPTAGTDGRMERRVRERAAIFHSVAWLNFAHAGLVLVVGFIVPSGRWSGLGRLVLLSVLPSFILAFLTRTR